MPELAGARAIVRQTLARLDSVEIGEETVDTGLVYGHDEPVLVYVRRRGRRYDLDDAGAAVSLAGEPPGWLDAIGGVVDSESFNVNRRGLIFVPVGAGRDLADLAVRLGSASRRAYLTLLDLQDRTD